MSRAPVVVCMHCDVVHRRVALVPRGRAHCVQCGSVLYSAGRTNLDAWLALTLTAAIVYPIANLNPIVEVELRGEHTRASLFEALIATWQAGVAPVAVLAALCALVFPMLRIGLELYVLTFLQTAHRPPALEPAMHALRAMRPWSMVEVFMLGIVVAVVKLGGEATVIPGVGMLGFAALTVLLPVLATFDTDALWDRADKVAA
ncbi:MAG: paraquat-inducible protein A [Panacagrimonas sp.]